MLAPSRAHALAAVLLLVPAAAARPSDLDEITARGTLRVLVVPGSPQFFALQPGAAPGFDREILDGFARLRNLKVAPVAVTSWNALLPELAENHGDVAAGGLTATAARRQLVDFSTEVFPSRLVVLTRAPRPAAESLEALRAERVGTIRGTSLSEAIAALKLPSVDDTIAPGGLPEALRTGRVGAIVLGVEDAIALQQKDPAVRLGVFVGARASLAFAVRKQDVALRRALDEYVGNLRRTPTWSRLVVRYFGDSAPLILKKAQQE